MSLSDSTDDIKIHAFFVSFVFFVEILYFKTKAKIHLQPSTVSSNIYLSEELLSIEQQNDATKKMKEEQEMLNKVFFVFLIFSNHCSQRCFSVKFFSQYYFLP